MIFFTSNCEQDWTLSIGHLQESTMEMKDGMNQMNQHASGITDYAQKVANLARGTMENIAIVDSVIAGFKT